MRFGVLRICSGTLAVEIELILRWIKFYTLLDNFIPSSSTCLRKRITLHLICYTGLLQHNSSNLLTILTKFITQRISTKKLIEKQYQKIQVFGPYHENQNDHLHFTNFIPTLKTTIFHFESGFHGGKLSHICSDEINILWCSFWRFLFSIYLTW